MTAGIVADVRGYCPSCGTSSLALGQLGDVICTYERCPRPQMITERLHSHDDEYARPFVLIRDDDETGVSGRGLVCDGVLFPDGRAVTRWRGATTSAKQTCVWDSLADIERVHGHSGKTRVVFR